MKNIQACDIGLPQPDIDAAQAERGFKSGLLASQIQDYSLEFCSWTLRIAVSPLVSCDRLSVRRQPSVTEPGIPLPGIVQSLASSVRAAQLACQRARS